MDKKKMIGDIVTSITDKELKKDYFYNAVPLAVILGKDAKEGTLWAAFASYAPGCKMIEVAAICDNTILGSGKKGILFSTEGIYGSMFNKNRKQGPIAMPIKYEELDSARPSPRDKSEVELVFKGGRVEKIYVYTYTGFVITALNRILEELKREKEREKEEKIRKIQQEKQLDTETIYETTKNPPSSTAIPPNTGMVNTVSQLSSSTRLSTSFSVLSPSFIIFLLVYCYFLKMSIVLSAVYFA